MQKKKIILWVVLLFVTHALFFVGGSMRGKQITQNYFAQEFENSNAHVILGHYSAYRDIVLGIKATQDDKAKCEAELMATAMFDSLKSCLANDGCKQGISKKAHEFAPEILGERPLSIETRTSCP